MAIFTVSTFATFAGLLLAVQKLGTDPNPINRLKALADLATDAKTLASVLAGAGLSPLAKEMEACARNADAAFAREPATEDARAIFWQVAPTALADPALMTAGDAVAVTNGMVEAILASLHAKDFTRTPMAEDYFRAIARPTLKTMLARADFIASITPVLWPRLAAKVDALPDILVTRVVAALAAPRLTLRSTGNPMERVEPLATRIVGQNPRITLWDVRDLLNPASLPNPEIALACLPTEERPYSWHDHIHHVGDPRTGFSGDLISCLLEENFRPGFLSPVLTMDFALMLLEVAFLFPKLPRMILRGFCLIMFQEALSKTPGPISNSLWHRYYHNFADVEIDHLAWGIREQPLPFGVAATQLDRRRAENERALWYAEHATEPLARWKEKVRESISYERGVKLAIELAHPDGLVRRNAERTAKDIADIPVDNFRTLQHKITASIAFSASMGCTDTIIRTLESSREQLFDYKTSEANFISELLLLMNLTESKDRDASDATRKFLERHGPQAMLRVTGHLGILLPSFRRTLAVVGGQCTCSSHELGLLRLPYE